MKSIFFGLILSLILISCSKSKSSHEKSDVISFITIVDINNATKDGIYMNGYVVEINYDKIKNLNGKKVKITGKMVLVKRLINLSDENDNKVIKQGRSVDMKHIISPKIEIIDN